MERYVIEGVAPLRHFECRALGQLGDHSRADSSGRRLNRRLGKSLLSAGVGSAAPSRMRAAEPILSLTGPPLQFPPGGKPGRRWLLEP